MLQSHGLGEWQQPWLLVVETVTSGVVSGQEPGRHPEGRVCLVSAARAWGGALPVSRGHTSLRARPLTPATQRPLRVLEEASARASGPEVHGTSHR